MKTEVIIKAAIIAVKAALDFLILFLWGTKSSPREAHFFRACPYVCIIYDFVVFVKGVVLR